MLLHADGLDLPDYTPLQYSVYGESPAMEFQELWSSDVYEDVEAIADVLYYMHNKMVQLSIVDNFLNETEIY